MHTRKLYGSAGLARVPGIIIEAGAFPWLWPSGLLSASVTVWMEFKSHLSPTPIRTPLQFQPQQCQVQTSGNAELSLVAVYLWGRRACIFLVYFSVWCSLPTLAQPISNFLEASTPVQTQPWDPSPHSLPGSCSRSSDLHWSRNLCLRSSLKHPSLPGLPGLCSSLSK